MKKLNKRDVAPEYNRIPHFNKEISNMTHDDLILDCDMEFPINCWVQEKVDGSCVGISWLDDAPVLRNREHILKKGYTKIKTPAKKQFTSAWNWVHAHKEDIEFISEMWMSPLTIYGEWMNFAHSIYYDKLPDLFLAYDIYSMEDDKYLAPDIVENLLSQTSIFYIKPEKIIFNSIEEIVRESEKVSNYRHGIVEGIVLKISEGAFLKETFKVVNKHFIRREDFNITEPIRNKIK